MAGAVFATQLAGWIVGATQLAGWSVGLQTDPQGVAFDGEHR